jgi:hypothetical protein
VCIYSKVSPAKLDNKSEFPNRQPSVSGLQSPVIDAWNTLPVSSKQQQLSENRKNLICL